MDIMIASGNKHKIFEIRALLSWPGVRWLTPSNAPGMPDVDETGSTFMENAILKARAYATHAGCLALADDSGLEVNALGGDPGVRSARYCGRHGDDTANNRLLLERLAGRADRTARFRCSLALAAPDGTLVATADGTCEGTIALEPAGDKGFGYDPLFIPDGETQTFGELGLEAKSRLSHRSRALRSAAGWTLPTP